MTVKDHEFIGEKEYFWRGTRDEEKQNQTELSDISFHAGLGVVGKGFPKKETLDVYRDLTPIPGTV